MSKKRLGINHFVEIFTPNPSIRKNGGLSCDNSISGVVADAKLREDYCRMAPNVGVLFCLTHKNHFNILTEQSTSRIHK
jgi:hypothetical protein